MVMLTRSPAPPADDCHEDSAARHGVPPAVQQRREQRPSLPDYALANMIAGQHAGLVQYDSKHVCLEKLLVQAIRAARWRQMRDLNAWESEHLVAIVCPSLKAVRWAHRRLRSADWKLRVVAAELMPRELFDVVVCTWPRLQDLRNRLHTCLVLEPTTLLTPRNIEILPDRCRIFGFLSPDRPLATSEREQLTDLLAARSIRIDGTSDEGEAVAARNLWLTIPRHGEVCRPVHVLMYPFGQREQVHHQDALTFKQQAVWHAAHRNRQVASLAKRVVTRQGLAAALDEALEGVTAPPLVVVESLDHAAVLHVHHLRDWPVLCLEGSNTAGLPDKARLHPIPKEPHRLQMPAIATFAALPYLEQVDVILRADAWRGELPLGVEPLSCSLDNPQPLVVIDLKDRTSPRLRRNARRREQTYRRQSWCVENLRPKQK